ncbi:MAG TPA: hypothetical protein VH105_16750 [Burkholderiales bacterium]|jgi:hypothetical protein|nr:hypothetical protein [Burkholderiales bacterium]
MQDRPFSARSAVFLAVALAIAVFGGMFFFGHFFGGHSEADCQALPIQLALSPSGQRQARQEQEACGSTDELHTRVLLGASGGGEPVTAFAATTGKALGANSVGQRALALTLRWEGENRLLIIHPANVASQLPAGIYGGVEVRLQAAPAAGH